MIDTVIALSEAEYRVLDELCKDGASNRIIGKRLFLAESTVKTHLKTITRAVGAANRTDLALGVITNRYKVGLKASPDTVRANAFPVAATSAA